MGQQDTTREFTDEIIQVQRVQLLTYGSETWRMTTEVCVVLYGKCDHGQDS